MGKKVRLASLQVGKKNDRNSDLEAAVTSVVSRRWRHLLTFVTHQDFNAAEMIVKFGRNRNHAFCEMERQKYVHCENQVFIFLIDATVEEWRVWFDLANHYKGNIDKWLKFALPRRVQGLLLDLSMNGHHMRLFVKSCTIPYEMLGLIEGTTLNNLSSRSGELVHVKVVEPSLAVKHLEIGHFHNKSSLLSMGKEVRLASLQKKDDHYLEDRISLLPDELLIFILSLLSLKEAAVTSTLCTRWRHLWAFIGSLNFDAAETLASFRRNWMHHFRQMERKKYVNWVNQVVLGHKGPTIEEFRVRFDLDKRFKGHINKWLKFALGRKVQRLVLDLSLDHNHIRSYGKSYTIPFEMLGQCEGTSLNSSSSDFRIPPRYSSFGFKSLKELCLKCVNVSGEILECFLSSCPLLEILCVHGSGELVNFKVVGPSLALKCLEICDCDNIESIEVNNVNLVALRYDGPTKSFSLQNVPLLVELSIWGSISWFMNDFLPQHSCCLSQLEIITLDISFLEEENSLTSLTPELTNVKKLVLVSSAVSDDGLLGCTSLLKAFPALQKLVWQMRWINPDIAEREIMKAVKCPCPHLEEVELAGYYGRITDLELVRYFVENAVSLKKIVIHPHDRYSPEIPKEIDDTGKENAARVRAKQQLEGEVPAGIELAIL
ncbi:putative FBD-associated F-box protein At5g56440 isoform X2 [Rhododendron vialii]|nr:putative FBD-associated F-box protein At5g56440 isoform X2 [Rhododendron vialii]XP_058192774.1 putative FBD-associated F-box protein At5g56440 isoform X2 [Rhododendron vialii]XP_058192783.1 putative FBD-associated F-box protein At5g56440 isoform X2 [Rhododendron vialii]XP_058192791.1 putative FBD-associated F-box protein At5g56440 isoform X2 [Rhododendron vialii]XP_058192797.1 putative FBD-associated F-box protein At5g56440 isoform X2 [Rhododendron vialii]XP_058192805.1 putative FBD-associa